MHTTLKTLVAIAMLAGAGMALRPIDAEDIFVAYLEGLVEYQQSGRWQELFIGDSLEDGTRVRLEDGAYLEVVVDRRTLRISQGGMHRLDGAAVPAAATSDSSDVRGLLSGAVRRFSQRGSQTSQQSVTAGVRASEAATDTGIDWAGDESPRELIDQGLAELAEDRVDDASFLFEDAFVFADGSEREEAGFWFVYSLYLLEETDLAVETLAELDPETDQPFYPDFALLAAELLEQDGRVGEARALVQQAIEARPDLTERQPLAAQALYFTLGRLSRGSNPQAAREALRQAASIAPGTALAEEATRLQSAP